MSNKRYEFRFFGYPQIYENGKNVDTPRKVVFALAAYLTINQQPHGRDTLATLLWPDVDQATARTNLRRVISWLRAIIANGDMISNRATIELKLDNIDVDVHQFEAIIGQIASVNGNFNELTQIKTLYQGEFLAGYSAGLSAEFEQWQTQQQERFRQQFINALKTLARYAGYKQDYAKAIEYLQLCLQLDVTDEQAHRLLMQIFALNDQRTQSIKQYQDCAQVLSSELGVMPSDETMNLFNLIETGDNLPVITIDESHEPITIVNSDNPYQGLNAFQEEDSAFFFGREALVTALVERMRSDRLVVVTGPSGSGKSSVVKAGLLPAIRANALPNSINWQIVQITPGNAPVKQLANALASVSNNPAPALHDTLWQDEHGLTTVSQQLLSGDDNQLLLIIDQFEELFTLVDDPATIEHYLDLLYFGVSDQESRIRIVITLRADFYHKPLAYNVFGRLIGDNTLVIEPMTPEELERAITKPAEAVGVTIAPRLIGLMISDVSTRPGTLPMLQYALFNLFEQRDGKSIGLSIYQKIGGVLGALTKQLDHIYIELSEQDQKLFRQMMLRLVAIDDEGKVTKRRVLQSDLRTIKPQRVDQLISMFASARVLTVDNNNSDAPTVELAHEALISEWHIFSEWIMRYQSDIQQHRLLLNATKDWLESKRENAYLLQDTRLSRFQDWVENTDFILSDDESTYIQASIDYHENLLQTEKARHERELLTQQRARQRLRYLAVALLLFSVIVSVLGVYALDRQNSAVQNAQISQSLALAANSRQVLDSGDIDTAIALAMASVRGENVPPQAELALAEAVYRPATVAKVAMHDEDITALAYSPNGKYLVSGSLDNTVRVMDASTYQTLHILEGHSAPALDIAVSADSQYLISGSMDKTVRVWSLETGEQIQQFEGHESTVTAVETHPERSTVLSASEDGVVILWDMLTGEEIRRYEGNVFGINTLAFSPDGQLIASGSTDAKVIVWDTESGEQINIIFTPFAEYSWELPVIDLSFAQLDAENPDNYQIITGHQYGYLMSWDMLTGEEFRRYERQAGHIKSIDVDQTNNLLVSGSQYGQFSLIDLKSGKVLQTFTAPDMITALRFDSSGEFVAYALPEPMLYVHDITQRDLVASYDNPELVMVIHDIAIHPTEDLLVTVGATQGSIGIFDTDLNRIKQLGDAIEFFSLTISPDGKWIVGGSRDGMISIADVDSESVQTHKLSDATIFGVDFSEDGKLIVAGSGGLLSPVEKNDVIIWDVEAQTERIRFSDHTERVNKVMFRPNTPEQVVSVSDDGTLRIWDVDGGNTIKQLDYNVPLKSLDITADGRVAITGVESGEIVMWNLESGEIIDLMTGHTRAVNDVQFNQDDSLIASVGNDGDVFLWDAETGSAIRQYGTNNNMLEAVAFGIGDNDLFSGGHADTFQKWRIDSLDELIAWTESHRYIRDFTCAERDVYAIEPLCSAFVVERQAESAPAETVFEFDMAKAQLIFSDDFSDDSPWIDITDGAYARNPENEYLDWHAQRDWNQLYYAPIPTVTTPVKFRFRINVTEWENNNGLQIGLAESLTNDYTGNGRPTGAFVDVGWFGGGTEFQNKYISAMGYFMEHLQWYNFNWNAPSTFVPYDFETWYWIEMTIVDQTWEIQVFEEDRTTLKGELSGTMPESHLEYRYFMVFNPDHTDWPAGTGMLDDIEVWAYAE